MKDVNKDRRVTYGWCWSNVRTRDVHLLRDDETPARTFTQGEFNIMTACIPDKWIGSQKEKICE